MTGAGDTPVCGNPFSTRYVRPGAIPFLFPSGTTAESLVQRLRDHRWRGEIVGGHGTGKSALVAALIPAIEAAGREVLLVELHDGQRRLPPGVLSGPSLQRSPVVIVDGYEQLSGLSRFRLKRACARRGLGLVVTAHRPAGFPGLARTQPDAALAQRIVGRLLGPNRSVIGPEEVSAGLAARHGNLREVLFDLYDLYERRRPG